MCELRHCCPESLVDQNLFMRISEMVLPANHVGDFHIDVVDHDGQVIKRVAIRTKQYKIFNLRVAALLWSINNVVESCLTLYRNFQSDRKWLSRCSAFIRFVDWQITIRIAPL